MKFYRYEDNKYGELFEESITEIELEMVKETACGWWIKEKWGYKRWVSSSNRKRYAYPSKKEALESYIARKNKHISILSSQLNRAKRGLNAATNKLLMIKKIEKGETAQERFMAKKTKIPHLFFGGSPSGSHSSIGDDE